MMPEVKDRFDVLMDAYMDDRLEESQERELIELLNADPERQYRYAEKVKQRAISFIPEYGEEKQQNFKLIERTIKQTSENKHTLTRKRRSIGQIAAAVLLLLTTSISGYYIIKDFYLEETAGYVAEVVTPHGSQSQISLPDGSKVWLNSGSILSYDNEFGKKDRKVTLQGEGYFEVAKDQNKPFLVSSGEVDVQVLGTTFNVRSYREDPTIEINLMEGSVAVTSSVTADQITLKPDQKAIYSKNEGTLQAMDSDVHLAAIWKEGRMSFVNHTFEQICVELERRFDLKIDISSERLRAERFSGNISLNMTIENVLDYFDVDNKYRWTRDGNVVRIDEK